MAETVGFIGPGNMGEPIAEILLRAGYGLRVFTRERSKSARLADEGASVVATAAEATQPARIVFTLVSDDRALDEICLRQSSFVEKRGHRGIHASLSAISPATARRLAKHHEKFGVSYAAAPTPLASLLHDRWLTSVAKGREDLRWAAIALEVAENAGIKAKAAP